MRKLEFTEILNGLCEELGLTPNSSRPFTFKTFKNVMLANDLIVTDRVIKTKWEQLLAHRYLIESLGKNPSGEIVVTLDVHAVRSYIVAKGKTPWEIGGESERDTAMDYPSIQEGTQ